MLLFTCAPESYSFHIFLYHLYLHFFPASLPTTLKYAQSYLILGNPFVDPAFPFNYHITITPKNQRTLTCFQTYQIIFTLILYRFINIILKIYELPFHKHCTMLVVMKLENNEENLHWVLLQTISKLSELTSDKYRASGDVSVEMSGGRRVEIVSITKWQSRERLF